MTRFEKKELIILKLEEIQFELGEYLDLWRKTGGGTTGHAIGSMIKQIEEKTIFFKNYC